MTPDQAVLIYKKNGEERFRLMETHGAIVASMVWGQYKPKKDDLTFQDLKNMGIYEEN